MLRTVITAAVATIGIAAIGTVGVSAHDAPRGHSEGANLSDVRRATARFHDESRARREGYAPVGACAQAPGLGGMGVHYMNAALARDATVDPRRPELLLYEPQDDGSMRLVGVEWFVADADQSLLTDDDRPSILGREFDGPMPGHEPGMPVHYDLHAYIWRHNPHGTFTAWNPNVHCR